MMKERGAVSKSGKDKKKESLLQNFNATEDQEVLGGSPDVVNNGKINRMKKNFDQNYAILEGSLHSDLESSKKEKKRKKQLEKKTAQVEEVEEEKREDEDLLVEDEQKDLAINENEEHILDDEASPKPNNEEASLSSKKDHLLKEAAKVKKSGVCYLSRIPPNMDHVNLRHILSKYGEIKRIYLAPEGAASHANRPYKKGGQFRSRKFSEGWVEFADKSVAKRVANMLNCEQIGGKKRSPFYYDLWNIKYLSKFKWDDLTEETAYKKAVREQKLTLEIAAAKRERDFYLKKVDQHLALTAIEDRLKKKQKVQDAPKVIRQFPQRKPVVGEAEKNKPKLSTDVLAGVFGGS